MATVAANFPNRPFRLEMTVNARSNSQDVAANTSVVDFSVAIIKNSYSPTWSNNQSYFWYRIDGVQLDGFFTYDFQSSDSLVLASGARTITHNTDGTKTVQFLTSADVDQMGVATTPTGSVALARIPRGPRVRSGGVWRNTVAYVRSGGVWKIAIPYVRSNGTWKIGGG